MKGLGLIALTLALGCSGNPERLAADSFDAVVKDELAVASADCAKRTATEWADPSGSIPGHWFRRVLTVEPGHSFDVSRSESVTSPYRAVLVYTVKIGVSADYDSWDNANRSDLEHFAFVEHTHRFNFVNGEWRAGSRESRFKGSGQDWGALHACDD